MNRSSTRSSSISSSANSINVLFSRESSNKVFHGVAKVGSIVSKSTSLKAQLSLWETEILHRKQQFGHDVFDIMSGNRDAGEGTGGEATPETVEIFADCATDVDFLIVRRHGKLTELEEISMNKNKPFGSKSRKSAYDMSSIDNDVVGPAFDDPIGAKKKLSWRTGFAKLLKKPRDPQEEQEKSTQAAISELNRSIHNRKDNFGVEMYDAMVALGEDYRPKDTRVAELYAETKKDVSGLYHKMEQAELALESSGNIIPHNELKEFVNTHPQIWAMLSVNCQIEEDRCKDVAFRVALELVSGKSGHDALNTVLTKGKFKPFQRNYIEDGKGHQEFFHRTVFMAFDEDWNGVLDRDETDKFLDTFYISGSIFQGDSRLPKKEELKLQILEQLDENGDGMFSFDEIRSLISGRGHRSGSTLK